MSRFRKGKADVLRIAPDAICHGNHRRGRWVVESATFGELTDELSDCTTPQSAWADAYETLWDRSPKIVLAAKAFAATKGEI